MRVTKTIIQFILILVFAYSGCDKIIHWEQSKLAFQNQTFPDELALALAYVVPILELVLAILIAFPKTLWWGYLGSMLLLTVFTTYVGLIWVGAFPRVPCNCAGILESLDWNSHFFINLFLIFLTMIGLAISRLTGT